MSGDVRNCYFNIRQIAWLDERTMRWWVQNRMLIHQELSFCGIRVIGLQQYHLLLFPLSNIKFLFKYESLSLHSPLVYSPLLSSSQHILSMNHELSINIFSIFFPSPPPPPSLTFSTHIPLHLSSLPFSSLFFPSLLFYSTS